MDPDFAAAFSSEYPEAYSEAVANQRRRRASSSRDAAIAIHVPVVPHFVSRFAAGVALILLLTLMLMLFSQGGESTALALPSGQLLDSSGGIDLEAGAERLSAIAGGGSGDLVERMQPIDEFGKDFQRETGS